MVFGRENKVECRKRNLDLQWKHHLRLNGDVFNMRYIDPPENDDGIKRFARKDADGYTEFKRDRCYTRPHR